MCCRMPPTKLAAGSVADTRTQGFPRKNCLPLFHERSFLRSAPQQPADARRGHILLTCRRINDSHRAQPRLQSRHHPLRGPALDARDVPARSAPLGHLGTCGAIAPHDPLVDRVLDGERPSTWRATTSTSTPDPRSLQRGRGITDAEEDPCGQG